MRGRSLSKFMSMRAAPPLPSVFQVAPSTPVSCSQVREGSGFHWLGEKIMCLYPASAYGSTIAQLRPLLSIMVMVWLSTPASRSSLPFSYVERHSSSRPYTCVWLPASPAHTPIFPGFTYSRTSFFAARAPWLSA